MSTHVDMKKTVMAPTIQSMKGHSAIACVTAYDYCTGTIADQSGADLILVGDSLAMVVLGHEDTLSVTMDEMVHHTKATSRGVSRALLVADMPFLSYNLSVEQALANAGRLVSEGRAKAVKLEGGHTVTEQIRAIVEAGIPVLGHIGLTPQHVSRFGGFKAQGKTSEAAKVMLDEALALEEAGAFAIVIEAVAEETASLITETLSIPTIGIGAGAATDGQILVFHDILGMFDRFTPKFVRRYAELGELGTETLRRYCDDVRHGHFPAEKHTLHMTEEETAKTKKIKRPKR